MSGYIVRGGVDVPAMYIPEASDTKCDTSLITNILLLAYQVDSGHTNVHIVGGFKDDLGIDCFAQRVIAVLEIESQLKWLISVDHRLHLATCRGRPCFALDMSGFGLPFQS